MQNALLSAHKAYLLKKIILIAVRTQFEDILHWTHLKELSHEIDFKNVDENLQILALTRAAAGY